MFLRSLTRPAESGSGLIHISLMQPIYNTWLLPLWWISDQSEMRNAAVPHNTQKSRWDEKLNPNSWLTFKVQTPMDVKNPPYVVEGWLDFLFLISSQSLIRTPPMLSRRDVAHSPLTLIISASLIRLDKLVQDEAFWSEMQSNAYSDASSYCMHKYNSWCGSTQAAPASHSSYN